MKELTSFVDCQKLPYTANQYHVAIQEATMKRDKKSLFCKLAQICVKGVCVCVSEVELGSAHPLSLLTFAPAFEFESTRSCRGGPREVRALRAISQTASRPFGVGVRFASILRSVVHSHAHAST